MPVHRVQRERLELSQEAHCTRRYSKQGDLTPRLERLLALRDRCEPAPSVPPPPPRRIARRVGDTERAEIVEAYVAGARITHLAREHGISQFAVRQILVAAGVEQAGSTLSEQQVVQIHALRAGGLSKMAIARRLGIADGTVRMVLSAGKRSRG